MHVLLVVVLLFVSVLGSLFSSLIAWVEPRPRGLVLRGLPFLFFATLVGLSSWLIVSSYFPVIVSRETVVSPAKIKNPDGTFLQMISYVDQHENQHTVNCSDQFHVVLSEDSQVLIREYKGRYYCGIIYDAISPTYSLVPKLR